MPAYALHLLTATSKKCCCPGLWWVLDKTLVLVPAGCTASTATHSCPAACTRAKSGLPLTLYAQPQFCLLKATCNCRVQATDTRSIIEATALLGSVMLLLDKQIPGIARERSIVAYIRLNSGMQAVTSQAAEVVRVCAATGFMALQSKSPAGVQSTFLCAQQPLIGIQTPTGCKVYNAREQIVTLSNTISSIVVTVLIESIATVTSRKRKDTHVAVQG